jgi:hypothetical protein
MTQTRIFLHTYDHGTDSLRPFYFDPPDKYHTEEGKDKHGLVV